MVEFEIMKHIGVINAYDNGWTREVNIVSWNKGKPKIDVREWSPDHTRMSKGITLTDEEAEKLCMTLHNHFAERSGK